MCTKNSKRKGDLLDPQHFVVFILHSFCKRVVPDFLVQSELCRSRLMVYLGRVNSGQSLERFFYRRLTVSAHHSFDLHCLCHCCFLLLFAVFYFSVSAGIIHVKPVEPERIAHDAYAGKTHRGRPEHRV